METNANLNPIKVLCGIFNVSLSQLGKDVGVSRQAVSLWINGHTIPSDENLNRISKKYGVSMSILKKSAVDEDDMMEIQKVFINKVMKKE